MPISLRETTRSKAQSPILGPDVRYWTPADMGAGTPAGDWKMFLIVAGIEWCLGAPNEVHCTLGVRLQAMRACGECEKQRRIRMKC
jgi:hypothetical protein